MIFRTKYSEPLKIVSKSGNGKTPIYDRRLKKNGMIEIYVRGVDDIYTKIQASAESADINTIIKKFTATGDESLLNTNPGVYLDLTKMPDSQFEAVNFVNQAKFAFEKLPVAIKKHFNNSFEQYIATVDTPETLAALGFKDRNNDGVIDHNDLPEEKKEVNA